MEWIANCEVKHREKWIVKFYNRISGSDAESYRDIPPETLTFILGMNFREVLVPFIRESKSKGRSLMAISNQLKVPKSTCGRI